MIHNSTAFNRQVRLIEVDETLTLRKMVLRPDLNLAKARKPYQGPEISFHIGVFEKGDLVSIASFIQTTHPDIVEAEPEANDHWMLRGMATHPKYRNRGLGSIALQSGMEEVLKYNPRLVWCSAREKATPFYKRLGFTPVGPIKNHINTGPHQLMRRRFVPVYAI